MKPDSTGNTGDKELRLTIAAEEGISAVISAFGMFYSAAVDSATVARNIALCHGDEAGGRCFELEVCLESSVFV